MSGRVVASIPTGPTFILAVQVTKVKQMIAIGILGIGSTEYRLAAWQSAQVASRNEEFEVFLGTDIELDSKIDRGELPFKLVSMSSGKVSFRAQPFIRNEFWNFRNSIILYISTQMQFLLMLLVKWRFEVI
jgi:hypothetical protein